MRENSKTSRSEILDPKLWLIFTCGVATGIVVPRLFNRAFRRIVNAEWFLVYILLSDDNIFSKPCIRVSAEDLKRRKFIRGVVTRYGTDICLNKARFSFELSAASEMRIILGSIIRQDGGGAGQ
jgi:hypothetical protein